MYTFLHTEAIPKGSGSVIDDRVWAPILKDGTLYFTHAFSLLVWHLYMYMGYVPCASFVLVKYILPSCIGFDLHLSSVDAESAASGLAAGPLPHVPLPAVRRVWAHGPAPICGRSPPLLTALPHHHRQSCKQHINGNSTGVSITIVYTVHYCVHVRV